MGRKVEYGFFALARAKGGIFRKADGSTESFEHREEAVRARDAWLTNEELPKAVSAVRRSRAQFSEDCTVQERRVKQSGFLNPDLVFRDLHGPDGEVIAQGIGDDATAQIATAAERCFPNPTISNLPASAEYIVKDQVIWHASLFLNGEAKRLPAFETWIYGFPIEGVLTVLNDLAADGWSVVQASEDRGIYVGATNQTDSAVTRARYLLVRG
jgi:hypothetical protein